MIIRFDNCKINGIISPFILQFDRDIVVNAYTENLVLEGEDVTTYRMIINFIDRHNFCLDFGLENTRLEAFNMFWLMLVSPPQKETNKFYNKGKEETWY